MYLSAPGLYKTDVASGTTSQVLENNTDQYNNNNNNIIKIRQK